jgi:4-diphosphocytidyl-2-C-methyl-D-erythritol kinase
MNAPVTHLYDLPAPAKLNLFLHITGRRADGYHLLQSVFMLIDWMDTLHLELRPGSAISREDIAAPAEPNPTHDLPADDLCVRAARALQQATGCTQGVHIRLDKRIPSQAGMGGGSSDAATCLLGLNRLWNLRKQLSELEHIGLSLGADVPFFLRGQNAWVEGVGDSITPIDLPPGRFVVLKPAQGLSTPEIFSHPELKRDSEHATILGFAAHHYDFGHNDLQPVAEKLNPQVTQALNMLRQQGLKPRMTGSGSAVFAKISGDETLQAVPSQWQQKLCSSLHEHPLRGWA